MLSGGGVTTMLAGVALAGVVAGLLGALLRRSLPFVSAWAIAGFVFAVACIGVLTLTPAYEVPSVVLAEDRPTSCSLDYGGPSPDGFWIVGGGQRLLNMVVFAPAGALLVLAVGRWRVGRVLAPLGLLGLFGYSVAIEWAQLEVARIDRACDITDMVDNALGALVGFGVGLVLLVVLRPWRGAGRRGVDRTA